MITAMEKEEGAITPFPTTVVEHHSTTYSAKSTDGKTVDAENSATVRVISPKDFDLSVTIDIALTAEGFDVRPQLAFCIARAIEAFRWNGR